MEWSETQGCISHNTARTSAWLGQSALQSSDQPRNSPVSIHRRTAITGDQQLDTARQILEPTRVGTFHTRAIPVQLGYTGDGGHRQDWELVLIVNNNWREMVKILWTTEKSIMAFLLYSRVSEHSEQLVKWMGRWNETGNSQVKVMKTTSKSIILLSWHSYYCFYHCIERALTIFKLLHHLCHSKIWQDHLLLYCLDALWKIQNNVLYCIEFTYMKK